MRARGRAAGVDVPARACVGIMYEAREETNGWYMVLS